MLFLLTAVTLECAAQRRLVAVDVETRVPVAGANVTSSGGKATTDSLGFFCIPDTSRTISITHVNYEPRIVNVEELRDTLFLISKLLNVKEVVVFGHGNRNQLSDGLMKFNLDKTEMELMAADPSSGGNLLPLLGKLVAKMIPRKWRGKSKKERQEELRKMLEAY